MRIAIIGGGITGLGAAWALRRDHEVVLFEESYRLGGHANTQLVEDSGGSTLAVDTGFIVHNRTTYPELIALFDELDVPTQGTEMSLSIECMECGLQYAGRRPWSLVVGALRRPSLVPLLLGVRRFMKTASRELVAGIDPSETLGDWCERVGVSARLRTHFVLPLTASVWSAPPGEALAMPAGYILGFLDNHGMLSFDKIEWRTVVGGSQEYVSRMRAQLEAAGVQVRCSDAVTAVHRFDGGVQLETAAGKVEHFDAAVFACHADQALALLDDADRLERELLGAWDYTTNVATLHDDPAMLPSQRSARAGWNYRLHDCSGDGALPTVSYFMNRLQRLQAKDAWSVTLNAGAAIDPARVRYARSYRHPKFSAAAVATQPRMRDELDRRAGHSRVVFCGAYRGFGFHEDGLRAGLDAGRLIGGLQPARVTV